MPGTTRIWATLVGRVASRRCADVATACLLVLATASCFVGTANDTTTGPSTGGGTLAFHPPAPPASGTGKAPTESDTVAITAHPETPGYTIPTNFVGLSLEITDAVNSARLADATLVRFLQNLGPGVIRIGGITADLHYWNPTTRVRRSDGGAVIINDDFDVLFQFSRATGWPVIYTVNLANNKPDTAAAEIKALTASGGSSLLAVAIGNEPDHYTSQGFRSSSWGWSNLDSEWIAYAGKIQARTPGTKFVGLDGCCSGAAGWLPSFVSSQASRLALGTHHIYPEWVGAPAGTTYSPSIPNLLDPFTSNRVAADVDLLYHAMNGKLPVRITESNSVASGGQVGVSNVFASSLWGLDHMYTLAEHGAVGVNFHGSLSGGSYQPLDGTPGSYTARPLYYAMLAFRVAAQGQTVPLTVTKHNNVAVHATVASDGTLRIAAINRETSTAVQVRINTGRTYSHAGTLRLTAPSLSSTSGVTFAGSGVSTVGDWQPQDQEAVYAADGVYAVSVPAASAAVITLQP